jgi:CheY-like chemotaxis protein
MLMNLVLNARDAMPGGGRLEIKVGGVEFGRGEVPHLPGLGPGRWACLRVSDTGTGMTAEVQDHLFEPFFTTKEEGKGTGLGLAQVYGIVKQHGGHVDVETALGEGSTFIIYLPVVEHQRVQEADETAGPLVEGRGETILVVEDAEQILRAIEAGLEDLGYHVLTAVNGREALENGPFEDVDLVLTDVVMPELGGVALLKKLRAEAPDLKVVAMTGHVMDARVNELKDAGFAELISKPFCLEELTRVVRDVLDC